MCIRDRVSSVAAYAYTENDDTLWTHLYLGSSVTKRAGAQTLRLEMTTEMPWQGRASMTVRTDAPAECSLAFRIPGWSGRASVTAPEAVERVDRDGYCYLSGVWHDGDVVTLDFPMEVHVVAASSRVREDTGKAAVVRGPITFCAEEADNGRDLHLFRLDLEARSGIQAAMEDLQGFSVMTLRVPALKEIPAQSDALYSELSLIHI